jgi:E3 ubiquitin-protein ligase TRIP12
LSFRWMLGEERYLSYKDIKQLDPVMAKSYNSLIRIINERDRIGQDCSVTSVNRES